MMPLTILALGHFPATAIESLFRHFSPVELIEVPIPPRSSLDDHKGELNRAVDAAANDWIFILREREVVDDQLAAEIGRVTGGANAWGFRITSTPFYAGRALRIGREEGEIRLFHRRHYSRFEAGREAKTIRVQGTVIRLQHALRSVTFESVGEHRQNLERTAVPHSAVRTALLFLRNAVAARTLDPNTLRYLWIEASFDHGV